MGKAGQGLHLLDTEHSEALSKRWSVMSYGHQTLQTTHTNSFFFQSVLKRKRKKLSPAMNIIKRNVGGRRSGNPQIITPQKKFHLLVWT
jgi:hypothetical protein